MADGCLAMTAEEPAVEAEGAPEVATAEAGEGDEAKEEAEEGDGVDGDDEDPPIRSEYGEDASSSLLAPYEYFHLLS